MAPIDSFDALVAMMPPRAGGGLEVDWTAVENAWGKEFPADYKKVIARYGDVLVGDYLQVISPTTITPETCDEPGAPRGGMGFITADTRDTWMDTEPTGIDAEPDDLVAWGAASSADLFCWLTLGEPDTWPVVVFSHDDDTWVKYDFGMTEFLVRVLLAQAGVEAMSDTPLWGERNPTYINSAEHRHAREVGTD
ncbi:SMI1/KNR4 family protein [Streptomyces griseorubiginosus]|uniref:SMI1/KNR4 family protein n=1 Tax=Streptomyces griseorubiginosus TaxID=67304 RepID=UPI00362C22B7